MGLRGILRKFEDTAERFRKTRASLRESITRDFQSILQSVERSSAAVLKVHLSSVDCVRLCV